MEMRKKQIHTAIRIICFLAACVVLSLALNWVTMPPNVVWMNLKQLEQQKEFDYLFVGTSHGQYGIDPQTIEEVTGKKGFSLCMADEYPVDTYYLLKEACRIHKPEKVVYELDPSYWILDQRQGSVAISFYKEFPVSLVKAEYFLDKIVHLDFRGTLFPWSFYKNNLFDIKKTVNKKLSQQYQYIDPAILDVPGGYYKGQGFLYQNRVEGADKGTFNNVPWNEAEIRDEATRYFKKMVEFCEENQIEFEVVTLPVPKETIQNMPESYQQSDKYFSELMKKYEISYKNYNFDENLTIDRSIDGYWDYDGHMYGDLAEQFSRILAIDLMNEGEK